MPILFLAVGILVIMVAVSGKQNEAAALILEDFRAASNFALLAGAVMIIALGGWLFRLPRAAHLLIILIALAYVLSSKGLWSQALDALERTDTPAPASAASVGAPATAGAASGSVAGGGGAQQQSAGGGVPGIPGLGGFLGSLFK